MDAFPAHAGMIRTRTLGPEDLLRVPRTRGDDPYAADREAYDTVRSPHTRG